jgi:hypothetical protein
LCCLLTRRDDANERQENLCSGRTAPLKPDRLKWATGLMTEDLQEVHQRVSLLSA